MAFIENRLRESKHFEIAFYYYIVLLAPVCLNAVHYLTHDKKHNDDGNDNGDTYMIFALYPYVYNI